jgi:hypothetical protein
MFPPPTEIIPENEGEVQKKMQGFSPCGEKPWLKSVG